MFFVVFNGINGVNGVFNLIGGLFVNDNICRFVVFSRLLSFFFVYVFFNDKMRCFVYGMQFCVVQGMFDFDFICKWVIFFVVGIIYIFGGQFVSKMYWGISEIFFLVYQEVFKVIFKYFDVDVVVNFVFFCLVYQFIMELMEYFQIKIIVIIVEGVFECVSVFVLVVIG